MSDLPAIRRDLPIPSLLAEIERAGKAMIAAPPGPDRERWRARLLALLDVANVHPTIGPYVIRTVQGVFDEESAAYRRSKLTR